MAEIIEMPKLSDTMSTGTLIKWLKQEGDEVAAGDMIAEVETDKATMEVENFEEGVMLKHYAKEGASVEVGKPICAVGEKGEEAPSVPEPEPEKSEPEQKSDKKEEESSGAEKSEENVDSADKPAESEPSPEKDSAKPESKEEAPADSDAPPPPTDDSGNRIKASPLARKIAQEKGVDLSTVEGTGPGGRIVKADVEKTAAEGSDKKKEATSSAPATTAAPATALEEKTEKVSNMRASIAKALVKSKQESPHFYLQIEVDSLPLIELRKQLNDKLANLSSEQGGIKFTVNDLILKASAEAVRRQPSINRSWHGDTIKQHGVVDLAFGVAIEEGLITPVIRNATSKGLREISVEARELIEKARNRRLKPDEMTNSTLTVTNLGMYGITDFYGIINPPNAAILSVGTTVKTPVVNDKDEFEIGYRMKIGLSGDHRVIDGAVGAQYLAALKEILESPALMLV